MPCYDPRDGWCEKVREKHHKEVELILERILNRKLSVEAGKVAYAAERVRFEEQMRRANNGRDPFE